jgi:hypothetical protein
VSSDNEATLLAASWPRVQPDAQQVHAPMQAVPWQQAQGEQTQVARAGMAPGTMNSVGALKYPVKRRRKRRGVARLFLALLLLVVLLAAAWFFAVRPYLHTIVQTQLDQALNGAEGQMILFQAALPEGNQIVHVDEGLINSYLGLHDLSPLQNLHATITAAGLRLDFGAYGFTSDIIVVPVASAGAFKVTNVQVQGVLWLVMSDDELTSALNTNFQSFGRQMNRAIRAVTLHDHEMDIQIQ